MTTIVGLDLSLTSTGIVAVDEGGGIAQRRLRPKTNGLQRLDYIVSEIAIHCGGLFAAPPDLVVIEGPAFGAKGAAYHQLAGLWWLIRHKLWTMRLPVAVASPPEVKKYATGKGNAGKDEVLACAVRRFPQVPADVLNNDIADALWLAAMGARHLGHPIDTVPTAHHTALDKVGSPPHRDRRHRHPRPPPRNPRPRPRHLPQLPRPHRSRAPLPHLRRGTPPTARTATPPDRLDQRPASGDAQNRGAPPRADTTRNTENHESHRRRR
jgi:crossover junction endodeoxyribonuclease RuvC